MTDSQEPDLEREEYEQRVHSCKREHLYHMRVPAKFSNLHLKDVSKDVAMPVVAWVENPMRKNLLILGTRDIDRVMALACLQILDRLRKFPLLIGSLTDLHRMIESPDSYESDVDAIMRDVFDSPSQGVAQRVQQCSFLCIQWFAEDDKAPLPPQYVRASVAHLIRQRLQLSKLHVLSAYSKQSVMDWYGRVFAESLLNQSTILNLNPRDLSYDDPQNSDDDRRDVVAPQTNRRRKRTACL